VLESEFFARLFAGLQHEPFNADFAEDADFADFKDARGKAACAYSILNDKKILCVLHVL
jgi:hypothetical protein